MQYLRVLYGLIMRQQHFPLSPYPRQSKATVTVAFWIDRTGALAHAVLYRTSGYPELDAEALADVRRAAPFPEPPPGEPHGFVAQIGFPPDVSPPPASVGVDDRSASYKQIVFGMLGLAKQFPADARARGARGAAIVSFELNDDGTLKTVKLLKSSGDKELDVESVAVVERAAPFPKPPQGVQRTFDAEIAFDPTNGSAITDSATPFVEYKMRLVRRIEEQFRFPRDAPEGTTTIGFTIDRSGKVISDYVVSDTGSDTLNVIALSGIRNLQFEPVPPQIPGDSFGFRVPLHNAKH